MTRVLSLCVTILSVASATKFGIKLLKLTHSWKKEYCRYIREDGGRLIENDTHPPSGKSGIKFIPPVINQLWEFSHFLVIPATD